MDHDMGRPPLQHAYRLLEKQTRDGLGAMVGVTGARYSQGPIYE